MCRWTLITTIISFVIIPLMWVLTWRAYRARAHTRRVVWLFALSSACAVLALASLFFPDVHPWGSPVSVGGLVGSGATLVVVAVFIILT